VWPSPMHGIIFIKNRTIPTHILHLPLLADTPGLNPDVISPRGFETQIGKTGFMCVNIERILRGCHHSSILTQSEIATFRQELRSGKPRHQRVSLRQQKSNFCRRRIVERNRRNGCIGGEIVLTRALPFKGVRPSIEGYPVSGTKFEFHRSTRTQSDEVQANLGHRGDCRRRAPVPCFSIQ
jgi:hypothetical protein